MKLIFFRCVSLKILANKLTLRLSLPITRYAMSRFFPFWKKSVTVSEPAPESAPEPAPESAPESAPECDNPVTKFFNNVANNFVVEVNMEVVIEPAPEHAHSRSNTHHNICPHRLVYQEYGIMYCECGNRAKLGWADPLHLKSFIVHI